MLIFFNELGKVKEPLITKQRLKIYIRTDLLSCIGIQAFDFRKNAAQLAMYEMLHRVHSPVA